MKKLDEQTALAILFANTKRKKRTEDLVTIAEACEYLVELYGTQKAVAEKVGLSSEMVREFRKILTLPREVQQMVKNREIDHLDIAYRISMVAEPGRQIEIARQVAKLQSKDLRDVKRLISTAGLSTQESKKKVLESKLKGLHVFVMDFNDEEYRAIIERARERKAVPAELVKQIVIDWLRRASRRGEG